MTTLMRPGFYPFWFWNDAIEPDEVVRQLRSMKEQGIRGVYLHPRQGMRVPYLSRRFFDLVEVAVLEGERLGLQVHLYDEFPYPSAAAAGQVVALDPAYRGHHLVPLLQDVAGGDLRVDLPDGRLLHASAVPLGPEGPCWGEALDLAGDVGVVYAEESYGERGMTVYTQKRYFASAPRLALETDLPPGRYRLFVGVEAPIEGHKYFGTFPDVLHPEAVQAFLALTHERYRQRLGERFGSVIPSIFTDETAAGWSRRIPERFAREYGYALPPLLPALWDVSHPRHLEVSRDLERLRMTMFIEAFDRPVRAWCREHGLLYAAEKMSSRLCQLREIDLPGVDAAHARAGGAETLVRARLRWNSLAAASAAYFYDKPGALVECFHSMGWGATLQDAKWLVDGMLLYGLSYLVPHAFFYSTHALRKHDAPPSFFFQMPYWRHWGRLSAWVEAVAAWREGTRPAAEVLVVEPSSGLPEEADLEALERLQTELFDRQLDFLYVDTDILEAGRIDDGTVLCREVRARVVVLPPMRHVEEPLAGWLERFAQAGGRVVRLAREDDAGAAVEEIARTAPPALRLRVDGERAEGIRVTTRAGEAGRRWLVQNTTPREVVLQFGTETPLREWRLDTALPSRLEQDEGKGGSYRRALAPFETIALEEEATAPSAPSTAAAVSPPPILDVPGDGAGEIRILDRNLLRLDPWSMALLDEADAPCEPATVHAVPLANQLRDGGFRFAPAIRAGFGRGAACALPSLRVRYTCTFENAYAGAVELVMEPDSLHGAWRIRINDAPALGPDDFPPTDTHVRGSLGCDITPAVHAGENRIEVELETDRPDGGLRHPLYLAGDFGVEAAHRRLLPFSGAGRFEAYGENGLPYYAGRVEYESRFVLETLPATETVLVRLVYAAPFREASEVAFGEGPFRPLLWQPRLLAVPRTELRVGENRLRTRVYTSLLRAFEGERFDYAAHAPVSVESPENE